MSRWVDDEEDPSEWARIDWHIGFYEDERWHFDPEAGDHWLQRRKTQLVDLQIEEGLARQLISYSDSELQRIVRTFAGSSGDALWASLRDDPRFIGKQRSVRDLWAQLRNPDRKPGPASAHRSNSVGRR